jgi:hypothetical protein
MTKLRLSPEDADVIRRIKTRGPIVKKLKWGPCRACDTYAPDWDDGYGFLHWTCEEPVVKIDKKAPDPNQGSLL